jgi:transcriptional regulator CtsR
MGISDLIAGFIRDALEDSDGVVELQRSDLAERFHCVPSQINYVMSTRFSPERGYIVESRRGGGGYIRITRVRVDRPTLLMTVINSIGESIDAPSAAAIVRNLADADALSAEAAELLLAALGDAALRSVPTVQRGALRADLMRQMLIHSV